MACHCTGRQRMTGSPFPLSAAIPGEGYTVTHNVRATLLDDPSWFVPFIETVVGEKLPWAYADLTDEYARRTTPA